MGFSSQFFYITIWENVNLDHDRDLTAIAFLVELLTG